MFNDLANSLITPDVLLIDCFLFLMYISQNLQIIQFQNFPNLMTNVLVCSIALIRLPVQY